MGIAACLWAWLLQAGRQAADLPPSSHCPSCSSSLPLQDRATIIPWLYAALDLDSTPGSFERCARLCAGLWLLPCLLQPLKPQCCCADVTCWLSQAPPKMFSRLPAAHLMPWYCCLQVRQHDCAGDVPQLWHHQAGL